MRFLFIGLLFICTQSFASDTTRTRLYNPAANVAKDIDALLVQAKKENKHLLIQVGGNWCVWCYKLNSFVNSDSSITNLIKANYVVYHLNYSKENKNLDYLQKLENPQRFGFPVLVVLNKDGRRLHTQDSALLEKGNGYDADKIKNFLAQWSPAALTVKE